MERAGQVSAVVDVIPARQRNMVFAGLMLAIALPAFDLLILATAGRAILDDLGGELIWMFIAYHITMVASMTFDPRLIWDAEESSDARGTPARA